MHSDTEAPTARATKHDSDDNIDSFIESMRIARNKTRLHRQTTLQRRRTLIEDAKDPRTDQEALEQEIRRVERLTSILGRRQTKFDRTRGPPKVNHDLDSTLDVFFEDDGENDRVGDLLLLNSHQGASSAKANDDLYDGIGVDDPVLKHESIQRSPLSPSAAALAYAAVDDPFDKIDETHHPANMRSASTEFLPLGSFKADDSDSEAAKQSPSAGVTIDTACLLSSDGRDDGHAFGGKVADDIDQILALESPESDGGLLPGITRSTTWKLQSKALIAERNEYGPALPKIVDESDDGSDGDGDGNEDQKDAAAAGDGMNENKKGSTKAAAQQPQDTPSTAERAGPSTTATTEQKSDVFGGDNVYSDYADMIDYYGAKSPAKDERIGANLQVSSNFSSEGDTDTDSDSDGQYIAHIGQRRSYKIVNVPYTGHTTPNAESNEPKHIVSDLKLASSRPVGISSSAGAGAIVANITTELAGTGHSSTEAQKSVAPSAEHGLYYSSHLESGARAASTVYGQQQKKHAAAEGGPRSGIIKDAHFGEMAPASYWADLKNGETPSAAGSTNHPQSPHSVAAEAEAAEAAEAAKSGHDPARRTQSLANTVNKPLPYVPATKHSSISTTKSANAALGRSQSTQVPGLAQLAENAVRAEAALPAKLRSPKALPTLPNGTQRRPPPIPDRIARTLTVTEARSIERSGAAAAGAQSLGPASTSSRLGKPPPPLPTKERPKIPKFFMDDKLGSHAAITAALERPSTKSLFGSTMSAAELFGPPAPADSAQPAACTPSTPAVSLEDWLRRTDELLPSNNPVAKPDPIPPASSGKPITFNTYRYEPVSRPGGNSGRKSLEGNIEPAFYQPNAFVPAGKSKGKVVRTVTDLPPSQAFSQLSTSNSPRTSQPTDSSAVSRSSGSNRASVISTASATETKHSTSAQNTLHIASAPATAQPASFSNIGTLTAAAHPAGVAQAPPTATSAPPDQSMYTVTERVQGHGKAPAELAPDRSSSHHRYTSAPPSALDTTLSAPSTSTAPYLPSPYIPDTPHAELFEPSAPMLVEPSAPQLPYDLDSSLSYSFPMPNFDDWSAHQRIQTAPKEPLPTSFAMPIPQSPTSASMYYPYDMAGSGQAASSTSGQHHAGYSIAGAQTSREPALRPQPVSLPSLPNKPRPNVAGAGVIAAASTSAAFHPTTIAATPNTALPLPPPPVPALALSPAAAAVAAITNALSSHNLPDSSGSTPSYRPQDSSGQSAEDEKARLESAYKEHESDSNNGINKEHEAKTTPLTREDFSLSNAPPSKPLTVDTHAAAAINEADASELTTSGPASSGSSHQRSDSTSEIVEAEKKILQKEREREIKRKAALFELVDTERTYTNDLRLVVELFLVPIQYLGNRRIVDVIFGDLVKVTEMNSKMYLDMAARLGPLAVFVDPEKAKRNKKKKKKSNIVRPSNSSYASGYARSVLHGSSIRTPTSPMAATKSASISRRLSNADSTSGSASRRLSGQSYCEVAEGMESLSLSKQGSRHDDRASVISNGDDQSIATSNSGGSGGEAGGHRYLSSVSRATSVTAGDNQSSVRSVDIASEDDENDATKWTEDQVLEYFKNVCIGDILANYLKDFSEFYALYSANHEKAIEYLKLVRESSSRLNLRNGATREAHQKLLHTLKRAEEDPRVRRLRLESFLLAPVQRVMRYPLLLEALLKYTPEDHPDHEDVALALSIAGSVATEVDRKSGELTNKRQLAELQNTFNWVQLLGGVQLNLDTYTKLVGQRRFVRKGPLRKASSGKHLYAILFNDFMMITVSERHGERWTYEPYRLPIQAYDLLARDPLKDQFELVNLKSGEVLQLRADTSDDAIEWVHAIMKTADNSYKVVCEAISTGIQISNVKSVISPEARAKILQGRKPSTFGKRF